VEESSTPPPRGVARKHRRFPRRCPNDPCGSHADVILASVVGLTSLCAPAVQGIVLTKGAMDSEFYANIFIDADDLP
jgi:hypothetical protein